MTNKQVAAALEEIALLLDLSGENAFKGRAYTHVARALEQSEAEVETLVREKRLREIKGVGDAIEQKITELVTTGSLEYLGNLRAKFPATLFELFDISGLGPKRIWQLYKELGIASRDALETACRTGALDEIKGFGPKMIEKILEGIEFSREHQGQHLYNRALAEGRRILDLLKAEPSVLRVELAGSLRRCKEVVKDVDIIASSGNPEALMARFVRDAEVARITGHGDTKSSVVLESGIAADLRVVSDAQFPFALAHFTGSKEHNVAMRQRAKDRGLKLNEYGLFREDESIVPCEDEAAIYAALDLPFIQPELREDMGEFALERSPRLLEAGDIRGVFHCHTTYSDGRGTLEEMIHAARERGYAYMTITDHSQSAAYAGGLQPDRVLKQRGEIDSLNKKLEGFRVLAGIESDIRIDGALDYEDDILATFDLIIASVHSKLDMDQDEATRRVIRAVENPFTTILGHPTGRLLLQRTGFPLDFEKVFDACAANKVAIEINANCHRLDLDWRLVHRARDRGVMLCIGPDAHSVDQIDNIAYGIGIARKGGLGAGDVLNSMSVTEFLAWRKK